MSLILSFPHSLWPISPLTAPELDYSSTDSMSSVSLAMAMIECIMKKRRNDWLDEAVVCLLHIHSNVLDAPEFLNKLYIELLVNIKVKVKSYLISCANLLQHLY